MSIPTPPASGISTPTTTLTNQGLTTSTATALASTTHSIAPLSCSSIKITRTSSPKNVPIPDHPASSDSCTDHMATVTWNATSGWSEPEIRPYGPLSLMPTASVLHYATECFEGLKLYRGHDSKLRLFRVRRNCTRMAQSAARIALPTFEPAELEKLIIKLCAIEGAKWLPKTQPGRFLYIRPTLIATDPSLGVQVPREALLYVIINHMAVLSTSVGLALLASNEDTVRAWPGGFGFAKVGANYGPSLLASGVARQKGFDQVLWLFGKEGFVTEAGAMNFFVVWKTQEGRVQLVTAPLGEKMILEGVTRASVLELARERLGEEVEVVERRFAIGEVLDASREGRLLEAFCAGTAWFIAPVGKIGYKEEEVDVPMGEGASGKYTALFKGWLEDIIYGRTQHEWGVVVDEE